MVEITALVAPIITLVLAIVIGVVFNYIPAKSKKRKPIPLVAFAVALGAIGLIFIFLFGSLLNNSVYSIGLFQNFASIFAGVEVSMIKYNAELVAATVLIVALEVGLASGFGVAFGVGNMQEKRRAAKNAADNTAKSGEAANKINTQTNPTATLTNLTVTKTEDAPEEGLRRDEQSMMELFLYGKVNQITPIVNPNKPEGYLYEGIPQLDWDTKRERQVLDTLVRKGFLKAELSDKVIVCKTCGSANIRVRKACPECKSLRLRKESLLEHFSCGAVERQSQFEGHNGDLICPKCKGKLQLIGSDYRSLPPANMCLSCNTLNSEPLITTICGACGSSVEIDEASEIYLYKYTANSEIPLNEFQQIKPLDICTKFFKSHGYTIVAPAFVSGRSGTQHLFDILVLGRVGWVETQKKPNTYEALPRSDNGNTAVEVLISSKPVELEEITRIYGKINDIDCDFIMFVIPGLTAEARNYAAAYNMKVCEGKNIEQALASSKIPKASEVKA